MLSIPYSPHALGAVGTEALGHVVDALELIAIGEDDGGDGHVVQTEGAMTALTIEMHMLVVVIVVTMVAVAEFIAHAVAAILDDVHQMVLAEEGERTEDARLVDGQNLVFQFAERQRTLGIGQRLHHHDAVGGGFDAVLGEQGFTCLMV